MRSVMIGWELIEALAGIVWQIRIFVIMIFVCEQNPKLQHKWSPKDGYYGRASHLFYNVLCSHCVRFCCCETKWCDMLHVRSAGVDPQSMDQNNWPLCDVFTLTLFGRTRSFDHGTCSLITAHDLRTQKTCLDRSPRWAETSYESKTLFAYKIFSALTAYFLRTQYKFQSKETSW